MLLASLNGLASAQNTAPVPTAPVPLPGFAELEAAGATIGEIRVLAEDIFDTQDPDEDKLLFRWANALHIQTRPEVIRRALLFKTGEPVSLRLIEETERLLRSKRYLYDVQMRPAAVHDGVVDIEVLTRDTWSLDPGISVGRSGGANSAGIQLKEYNLLGTGTALSFGHSRNVDRSSNELQFSSDRTFGSWTAVSLSLASNSDGRRQAASIVQPFYALDSRWAGGVWAVKDDRIDAFYNAGEIASQYRHKQDQAEVFAGWSRGLESGWVQRYSLGINYRDDAYAREAGLVAPTPMPSNEKLVSPFLRYTLIEDRFDRELNRNLIGRPEFFALGLASSVQLGYAATGLGSSHAAWLYSATLSRGFEPAPKQTLIASGALSGQYADGKIRRQQLSGQAQYYLPQSPRWLFYAAASGAVQTNPEPVDALLLGGDNGLRGYPLRYQSGSRSALFTVEERFYTDLYIWRLFRIGGAAFFDAGRAWGAEPNFANTVNAGWLSDVGFGARIVSARAAFSNVLHVDLAFPLNATADIKKVQFLVKTKASF
ncbi:BamA/TamA family outer membrane protein [Paucibacter sp. B2R-40]|uniref:BamA/TamA family outer membrane protein n=1 Tax=Paucibacter sp. B2R-40 TaxID=2893554 RepID=UPI0021E3E7C9|nr:BamA/TamA family outer membrane protein [Paucibacter sp. B2R-40]MCV2352674.1 BamA/TamA family outer membrane protein [Paucibacter sp. B2R-40]